MRFDDPGDCDGFGVDVEFAGLDARQVENVVDESEQLAACGGDGLREFHLLVAEIARLVVGEQLGEDEGRIERRAQLVAHVGQELALVLIGPLQFGGFFRQHGLRLAELVLLQLQQLRLLLQLCVGLLQLRLLRLQPYLGFLQRAGLDFQLLVADPQLFLLGLQFLGLTLRFGQQFLETGPILRGADRDTERFRDALQQLQVGRLHPAQKAHFHHALDGSVDRRRGNEQLANPGAAQTRGDREVAIRYVLDVQQAVFPGCLSQQSFSGDDRVAHLIRRDCVAGETPQPGRVFGDVQRADLGVQVAGEEIQNVSAQDFQALLALHPIGKLVLAGPEPGLCFACPVVTGGHDRCTKDQQDQHDRTGTRDEVGQLGCTAPILLAGGQ